MAFLKNSAGVKCKKRFLPLTLVIWLLIPAHSFAKELQLYEQEIKAGLLYNFLKYTNWPVAENEKSPSKIELCVFGEDPFNAYLQPMQGRSVNQALITIRNIHSMQQTADCQMLFINANEKKQWPELKQFISGKGILTVSDLRGFTSSGGMIEFGRKDNRINVLLNKSPLAEAKLSVQDRLLKLVTVVSDDAQGGQ